MTKSLYLNKKFLPFEILKQNIFYSMICAIFVFIFNGVTQGRLTHVFSADVQELTQNSFQN